MQPLRNSSPLLAVFIFGTVLLSLSCSGDKNTGSGPDNGPGSQEIQGIRAYYEILVQERSQDWLVTGPAPGVDLSFYPQRDDDHITWGRAALTTDNSGKVTYICSAGSLYVGETFTLNLASIKTGCTTDGWKCNDEGNSRQETYTVIKGKFTYDYSTSVFAIPQ